MEIRNIGFYGPALDDPTLLGHLPSVLKQLLEAVNGWIQFNGGFHMRGACKAPAWHSIREAWTGETAFHRFYPHVQSGWIPFAEDAMGDQFFWTGEMVVRLDSETGDLFEMDRSIKEFLLSVNSNPVGALALEPLLEFEGTGGKLEPGELLHVYPPFCTKESADGVSLSAVPAAELHAFHADFARQIAGQD